MDTANKQSTFLFRSLKGALTASAAGVALVALFAFLLLKQWLSPGSITYVNAGIKALCAALASFVAVRRSQSGNVAAGALAGAGYMLISFIVFSLISGSFSLGTALILDLIMCAAAGAIVGVVRNLRR